MSRFGVFEVDRRSGELRKQGVRIRLRDQSFQVLLLLLEHPGQVVTREELRSRLWSADTFVDFDRGLNKAVNHLRDALGDSAESPRFVETLPRRGYRFIAPVEDATKVTPVAAPGVEGLRRGRATARAIACVVLVVAAALGVLYSRRGRTLSERDRVVLADFDNRTGDAAFDYTLKQALALALERSSFLTVVPEQEVADTLRLMHRPTDQPLTPDVARDTCLRIGSQAVLSGSLALVGSEYVLGLNAVDCQAGGTLARAQVRARRKEDVLDGVDRAASQMRATLGESLGSIEKSDSRLHHILSTPSLEAFQAYTNGERMVLNGRSPVPFFRRAIELDPDFAYAHAALGLVYGTMGETARSSESTRRAYELRDRVSEWERYFVTAQYYFRVTGEIEKIPAVCQAWIESYPRDRTAHNRLAFAYRQLGRYEDALAEYQQARRIGRDHPIDLALLATTYMNVDRLSEAGDIVQRALATHPGDRRFLLTRYLLGFLQADRLATEGEAASRPTGSEPDDLLFVRSDTEAYFGRLGTSRELARQVIESARQQDFRGRSAMWLANAALREALFGNADLARPQAAAALDLSPGWDVRALAALALAGTGDTARAVKLADQLETEFPSSTLIQKYWLPAIRAQVALSAGNAAKAIEQLAAASAYEAADTSIPASPALYPAYLRGAAYLLARQGAASAAEFEKLVRHRGLVGNHPEGALAHVGLARAYALAGDRAKARTEYQYVLTLWANADATNPLFEQIKKEFAALR